MSDPEGSASQEQRKVEMPSNATTYRIEDDHLLVADNPVNYPSIVGAAVEKSANRQFSLRLRYVSDKEIRVLGRTTKQTNLVTIPDLDKSGVEALLNALRKRNVNIADFTGGEFSSPRP